jgi:hypothetical protein
MEASLLFRSAMDQARRADTLSLIPGTRLAIAEAAVRDGDKTARKQLTDLSADSAQRGYGLFTSRAQRLLGRVRQY